ncbi:MAG: rhodanese-like domain-containing protein [Planctomycetota bacterium]|nr:rhodanese-like domain-containing protein [Planctomycetota bacterium]
MLWIIGIAVVAVAALILAFKIWGRSADDFWGDIQERANERDQEAAEQKARARAEKKKLAEERAARRAAEAAGEEYVPPAAPEPEPAAEQAPASFTELSPADATAMLAERSDVTLLDVRTPGECMAGVIEGAVLIPMDQIQGRVAELPEGPLLVYCAVGARSAAVCDFLTSLGRKEVFNLDGGITSWPGKVVRPVN